MNNAISYLLVPVMAMLLASAQAMWNSAIKNQHLLQAKASSAFTNVLSSPRMWLGAFLYIVATVVYFILLSKNKFFSVQVSMTAVAIIFSTVLAAVVFNEKISLVNAVGMLVVLTGLTLVLAK